VEKEWEAKYPFFPEKKTNLEKERTAVIVFYLYLFVLVFLHFF